MDDIEDFDRDEYVKPGFWEYLKENRIWLLLGFSVIVGIGFPLVWILFQNNYLSDLIWLHIVLAIIWTFYLIGNYITWKHL